jgi:predicted PurR-regulated permease PerM
MRYADSPLWYRWLESSRKRRRVLSAMLLLVLGSAVMVGWLWLFIDYQTNGVSALPWLSNDFKGWKP